VLRTVRNIQAEVSRPLSPIPHAYGAGSHYCCFARKAEAELVSRWARGGQGNIRKPPKARPPQSRSKPSISGKNAQQPETPASNGAES
jgi:hypothetical protein